MRSTTSLGANASPSDSASTTRCVLAGASPSDVRQQHLGLVDAAQDPRLAREDLHDHDRVQALRPGSRPPARSRRPPNCRSGSRAMAPAQHDRAIHGARDSSRAGPRAAGERVAVTALRSLVRARSRSRGGAAPARPARRRSARAAPRRRGPRRHRRRLRTRAEPAQRLVEEQVAHRHEAREHHAQRVAVHGARRAPRAARTGRSSSDDRELHERQLVVPAQELPVRDAEGVGEGRRVVDPADAGPAPGPGSASRGCRAGVGRRGAGPS